MSGTFDGLAQDGFDRRELCAERVRPRRIQFSFPQTIPKHWVGGSPVRTHLMNSLNLFLPAFERMIMRTVGDKILPQLRDDKLREQARGFMGQEATHSRAHALFLENLRGQGYRIERFLGFTEWFFEDVLEKRCSPKLGLAVVAGFEHYTDLLVVLALRSDFLARCDPHMKELLLWHAAEEVEHNAVAYEMFRALGCGYALRMLGSVLGLGVTVFFMLSGAMVLLKQDRKLFDRASARELFEFFFSKYSVAPNALRLFAHYARPSYRPDDVDYSSLAHRVLDPEQTSPAQG